LLEIEVDPEINLTQFHESLAEELFSLISADREYLSQWLVWPKYTKTVEDSMGFINSSIVGFAEGRSMSCAIIYRGEMVGVVGFRDINRELNSGEIGYWISSNHQGKGIVTKSCKRLIQYAFNDLGIEKVEISVASDNSASCRVCERLGLKLECTIKNAENLHGILIDHVVYGIHSIEI